MCKKIIIDTIYKYTNVNIKDEEQNLLELPIFFEYWLYIIVELEDQYKLPIIQVLEEINVAEFTLKNLTNKIISRISNA